MYIAIISSTQELPDLEKLHKFDPSIPIIFFNLRLDVLVRSAIKSIMYISVSYSCTINFLTIV